MKIPLEVVTFAGGLRIMVKFLLVSKELNIFTIINGIVDTGSPTTIIGALDCQRMRLSRIKLNQLNSRKEPVALGGDNIEVKVINEAKIKFGDIFECIMPVRIPVENAEKSRLPTIRGVDFLLINKFKLVFNPFNREAYFEKEEVVKLT
jgi:hypothetical protein